MYAPPGVKTSQDLPVPDTMKAWVLGDPGELQAHRQAGAGAEARRGAGAHRRGRDLRHRSRDHLARPAGDRFRAACRSTRTSRPATNTWARWSALGPGVDEYQIGQRVTVEIHAGCGQCKRCRAGHVHLLPQLRPQLRRRRQGPPRQRLHHRRRLLRIPGQQHQHAGRDPRRHVGRGSDAGRHRRHRDVRPDRTRRAGRRRERGRHRPRADRPARRRGRQGARRAAGDPDRHARQPPQDRPASSAPTTWSTSRKEDAVDGGAQSSTAARASTMWSNARARRMPSTRRSAWSIAAARCASRPSRTSRRRSMSPTSCATTSTSIGIRGEGKSATHRAEAFMAQKRFDATRDPHPHLPARGAADRDPIRARAHRRRHQGGGEGEDVCGAQDCGRVSHAGLLGRALEDHRSGRIQEIHRSGARHHRQVSAARCWPAAAASRSWKARDKFHRFVVIEFPTLRAGRGLLQSDEYDKAAAFRRSGAGEVETIMVDAGDATRYEPRGRSVGNEIARPPAAIVPHPASSASGRKTA